MYTYISSLLSLPPASPFYPVGHQRALSWESSTDVCTLPCVRYIASGKLLYSTGNSAQCSVMKGFEFWYPNSGNLKKRHCLEELMERRGPGNLNSGVHGWALRMNPLGWLWCSPWFWCLGVSARDVKSGDIPPGVFLFLVVRGTCVHAQLCLTVYDPMDCSLPGSSVHGIIPARILEWVAISFSKGSSQHRDWTRVSWGSCFGRWILNHWATQGSLWLEGAGCQMLAILTRPYSKWSWVLWPEERRAQFPPSFMSFAIWIPEPLSPFLHWIVVLVGTSQGNAALPWASMSRVLNASMSLLEWWLCLVWGYGDSQVQRAKDSVLSARGHLSMNAAQSACLAFKHLRLAPLQPGLTPITN